MITLKLLPDDELISLYSAVIRELKSRKIIRTKNVVGDLGEYMAIRHYCSTKGLPNLQPAPPGTKNVDALSRNGERYSIKATTGTSSSVFYGLNPPGSVAQETPRFEYVLVVIFDSDMTLRRINEVTWEQFLHFKRWHSRMEAWRLPVTKELLEETKTVYIDDEVHVTPGAHTVTG